MSTARRSILLLAALALVAASAPVIVAQGGPASEDQLRALEVQYSWLETIAAEREAQGVELRDSDVRELRIVGAQVRRFQELQAESGRRTGVPRREAEELQDRIARLWTSLRAAQPASPAAAPAPSPRPASETVATIPSGTRSIVRLATWLSSKNAAVGDRFSVILAEPIHVEGRVAVPQGAVLEGLVTDVERAGRASDAGQLQLLIDRLRGDQGQIADVRGLVVGTATGEDLEGRGVNVGRTAAVGAIGGVIGGLLGGGRGALIGIGVGAGGTILADSGKDVDLPQGTLLRVEFQSPVAVTWTWRPLSQD